ncbi:ABC transporter ATP-binding protein [Vineibacter terrae]|uniref:ABC transporter ATP-binding protein n=1 Tax=Vineibacter terrae TaxID=2586908 RepID=UPI002E34A899|nr:ABC transporter ATP-binding protein [Vineibacter terrae]HEX2885750.1 ABC transporter ATP-binding protein [Vineibacter terrae]
MPETPPPAIELRSIEKSFGAVRANRDVSLQVARGSITGIIGENGAGKSTLMSILYGLYEADSGEIHVDGRRVRIRSPRDAIASGIGMVHQHFMLIDTFTVLENVVLGAEAGPVLRPSLAAARRELERLGRDYGLRVDPDAIVGTLPVSEQQRVEILKVLYRGARILILDEPSAVLTPQETEQLFRILQALRARGATVILITHKLREIMAVTDMVHVMRHGQVVAQRRTAETSSAELAELMVGRKVRLALDKTAPQAGTPVLRARGIGLQDSRGVRLLDGIDLDLRAGEIVGIAGVSGNGQSELLEVLAGIRAPSDGSIAIGERVIDAAHPADPAEMRALGLAHVPEDRHRYAMVAPFAANETAILGYHNEAPFSGTCLLHHRAMVGHCAELMDGYDVRPRQPALRSSSFSGGNQQKLILAREIATRPRILLVGQPTRGVDIGAIEFIHRQLVAARDAGCAILVVSVELDEVMALADRILVMFGGRIVGEVAGDAADERTLGLMMANVHMDPSPREGGEKVPHRGG